RAVEPDVDPDRARALAGPARGLFARARTVRALRGLVRSAEHARRARVDRDLPLARDRSFRGAAARRRLVDRRGPAARVDRHRIAHLDARLARLPGRRARHGPLARKALLEGRGVGFRSGYDPL